MTHPIVQCARGYLGTRFHHQGRLKKTASHHGGIDCLGLLIEVARELDLRDSTGKKLAAFDSTDYPHYPDTQELKRRLSQALTPVRITDITEGNIALFDIDDHPQHLGIISDYQSSLGIIHAYAPARSVVEHILDTSWNQKLIAAYWLPSYHTPLSRSAD